MEPPTSHTGGDIITDFDGALKACDRVIGSAPEHCQPNIPTSHKELGGATRWHDFESDAWAVGEAIRRWLVANPPMPRDSALVERLIAVITTPTLRRGRQSFFMCLGASARAHAGVIAGLLADDDVCGHAASALLRMNALNFCDLMDPLLIHRDAHVRKTAERYIARCRNV